MKILKQMIEEHLKIKDYYILRRFYQRGLYKFYEAYGLSIAFLSLIGQIDIDEKKIKKRNSFYKTLMLKPGITEKQIRRMNNMMNQDLKVINKAIKYIEKLNEGTQVSFGAFYRPGIVAVDMDEFPLD